MAAEVAGTRRRGPDALGGLDVRRAVERPVAHDEAQLHLGEGGGIHEGVDPLQYLRGHEGEFLKGEVVLPAHDENIVARPERPRQRRDLRPHDHFPVLPEPHLHELFAVPQRRQYGFQLPAHGKHIVRPLVLVTALRYAVGIAHGFPPVLIKGKVFGRDVAALPRELCGEDWPQPFTADSLYPHNQRRHSALEQKRALASRTIPCSHVEKAARTGNAVGYGPR